MHDEPQDKPTTSLWTTPASQAAAILQTGQSLVDPNVTREQIREAVAQSRERASTFAGRVSEEILRASIE